MKKNTLPHLGIKWGLIATAGLLIYFSLMKAVGFIHILEFRLFNAAIVFAAVYFGVQQGKKSLTDFSYFKGLGIGLITSFTSALFFSLFGLLYLEVINPDFLISIQENEFFGSYITEFGAVFQIFIEGTFSGCLISFAVMQRLKMPRESSKQNIA